MSSDRSIRDCSTQYTQAKKKKTHKTEFELHEKKPKFIDVIRLRAAVAVASALGAECNGSDGANYAAKHTYRRTNMSCIIKY